MVKETYKSQVHDVKNKPPFWQLMPKACSLDAQGLFTRCPRLVHPMPKACSSDAFPVACMYSPLQITADGAEKICLV